MATITYGNTSWTTTAGNKTVTITPAVGDLIVVMCANSGRTTAQPPTVTDNNSSGTYTQVASFTKNTSADSGWCFIRNQLVAAASSTIFTMTQSSDTGGGLSVYRVAGMSRVGANALRQSGKQDNAAAGTPSIAMAQAILTANACIGMVFNGTNSTTTSAPPTGWAEDFDNGYNTPASGLEAVSRSSGETNSTVAWTGASASAFGSLLVELNVNPETGSLVLDVYPEILVQ